MTTQSNAEGTIEYTDELPFSSISYIDALIVSGSISKWGAGLGTSATISYSIPGNLIGNASSWTTHYADFFPSTNEPANMSLVNAAVAASFEASLQAWANVANLTFTKITDVNGGPVGVFRVAYYNAMSEGAAGWAYLPTFSAVGGDVWLNPDDPGDPTPLWSGAALSPGGAGFGTFLHEVGHALGLSHPGGGDGAAPGYDNRTTIMSYNSLVFRDVTPGPGGSSSVTWKQVEASTPMIHDIAAIQYLYGANTTYNNGDNTYSFDTAVPFFQTIWDAGGTDTISVSNFSLGCEIDLRPGQLSSIMIPSDPPGGFTDPPGSVIYDGTDNLGIAFNCIIENATGGTGNDKFYSNSANNVLTGGAGTDTVAFSGLKAGYSITPGSPGNYTVTDINAAYGNDGSDTLTSIENLQFRGSITFDFDADGKHDLLWRNRATGGDVLWKSANGATTQAVEGVGDLNWKIAGIGDFDGDGKSDFLWRNRVTGGNVIWKSGNSATTQAVEGVGDLNWQAAGVGDFDGDGKSDLLWRNRVTGGNVIWKSADSATTQAVEGVGDLNWQAAGVGDFDGDGKSDLLWRNRATGGDVLWKSANSATTQAVEGVGDLNWQVAGVGDFDGDGKSDLLWRNRATGADVLWKSANSATTQAVTGVGDLNWQVAGTGDYDGDGKSDLLWRNRATGENVLWKGGDSATTQAVGGVSDRDWQIPAQTSARSQSVTVPSDFEGDGKSDILWRNSATGAAVIWKNGDGATTQAVEGVSDLNWKIAGLGDFDGDGRSDLLWRNSATGGNTIWKSANSATTQAVGSVGDLNWQVAGVGDFDGDGRSDILWRNSVTGGDVIWKSGNGATTQAVEGVNDLNWKIDGVGDFDGDGRSDLLWRNSATGGNVIWKSANSATTQAVEGVGDLNWKVVGAGDFDGDGRSDILWRNNSTGGDVIWKSGNSATTQAVTGVSDLNWQVAGVGDFDGDGRSDILWRKFSTGENVIWKSGNSATTQAVSSVASQSWQIIDDPERVPLVGDAGDNTLRGTAQGDILKGGLGNDTLTGNAGADQFVFDTAPDALTNVDTITDFAAGADKLVLDDEIFTALTSGPGADDFVSGAGATAALDGADHLIYNSSTGALYYDADGTGASSAVQFATLTDHPAITTSDFAVS
jgi:hypothetical protein